MGSICSLNLATSVLASFLGIADSSSSTSVSQKVQRKVPEMKKVAKHQKKSNKAAFKTRALHCFLCSMLNSFSHSDNPFPHAVHLVIKQPRKQQALWCHPVIPSSESGSLLWEAQMCCSTTIETSPNLTPFLARRLKWARKAGQTETTETVAWQCSYKKKKTYWTHSRPFGFIAPSASRNLGEALAAGPDHMVCSEGSSTVPCPVLTHAGHGYVATNAAPPPRDFSWPCVISFLRILPVAPTHTWYHLSAP